MLLVLATAMTPRAFAQLAPTGEHYAGRPLDTGFGGTQVNAAGSYTAGVPLDLPPARGGLPIPLDVEYGGQRTGAAGVGWDVQLSYIQHDSTLAYRRAASDPGMLPTLRERTYLSLLGQFTELVFDGNVWVARAGTLELAAREVGGAWLVYDGSGRTYTFRRPAALGSTGLWLLSSISAAGGARVQLTYQMAVRQLNGGTGMEINLSRIAYNTRIASIPPPACAKNEILLTYGNSSAAPLAVSILDDKVLTRETVLTAIDVESRASCATSLQRLRRYQFDYAPDADTQLPRLRAVTMLGRQGTPEESAALPVAAYAYGSATQNGALSYARTQTIGLPSGVDLTQVSATALDPSVNAPGTGERYAMWQTLTDVTGDGRPDLVFKRNNKLWVALNQPAQDAGTSLGASPQAILPLSDTTMANGAFSTQTSTQRRFEYGPANRNTTDVWRQAIDVNGDGRMDIVDAAEEPNHWVVYLNTPDSGGVKWVRRSFLITALRQTLANFGHTIDGAHLPLSRKATGTDLLMDECWRWDGQQWQWWPQGFQNHRCAGSSQAIYKRGAERTFVEWELTDLNGDGYPDFVFNSSPTDFQLVPPSSFPRPVTGESRDGRSWHHFSPAAANDVRAAFNAVGVRFDVGHEAFSQSVTLSVPTPSAGVGEWECLGEVCDDSHQSQFAGFADVNGDGLADRVEGTRSYLGAYNGTGLFFSPVYLTLPGPSATEVNNHKAQCAANGNHKPTANQTQGLRDLTGDGIPDYYEQSTVPDGSSGHLWIGTGAGFRQPIRILAPGATFVFSHQTEACDGSFSSTDGGLFDIDGDGRPDVITLVGSTFRVSQLSGGQSPGRPEAGRLTAIDNGYGARTTAAYVSAKQFTDNPVPFPEIVVSAVSTAGTQNLGGTLAGSRYAYSNAELIFDSASDRFAFPGYRRTVEVHLDSSASPAGGVPGGDAVIADTWPLTAFSANLNQDERWARTQRTGRLRDLFLLRASAGMDPWSLLDVFESDPRVIGVTHYEYAAKLYQTPKSPTENDLDCIDMVEPLDFALTVSESVGNSVDACRAHGFSFGTTKFAWYGGSPPPSDDNIQTFTQTLAVDDFGRPLTVEFDNDVFRADDDICLENRFAVPHAGFPRVLGALASRRLYGCGKSGSSATVASESWAYDGLQAGSVSNGFVTSHNVDRRATDTGAVLNTIHVFDATYDSAGNLAAVTTRRGNDTRSATFAYDAFGLVRTQNSLSATGLPSRTVTILHDPVSLDPVGSADSNGTTRGIDFDGFGRPVRTTVTPPGGALGVLTAIQYLGFSGADPNGRRVVQTNFADPVPPANVMQAAGRTATMFLDELGRRRRSELALGSDYANQSLVVSSRTYDERGRVVFETDPYSSAQDYATAYGTSYYFTAAGDLNCAIRGSGPQPFTTVTNLAAEVFPACYQHSYASHVETVDMRDASSLQPGSPQAGVVKRTVATAIGRVLERSTLKGGARIENSVFAYDPLGRRVSMTRYLDPGTPSLGVEWAWRLDSIGQVLQLSEPETALRTLSYSDWGELLETQWVDGGVDKQLVRAYDALGRLTRAEERNNGTPDPETVYTYAYDAPVNLAPQVTPTFVLGRLAQAASPGGQTAFSYDALGRINAQVFQDGQGTPYVEKAVNHADGTLASLEFRLPDGNFESELVKYQYDSAGRLRGVDFADLMGARQLYRASGIDPFGRPLNALYGGATALHATYADQGRRLLHDVSLQSSQGSRRIILGGFDPLGRELSRREFANGTDSGVTTPSYDALGRMVGSTLAIGTQTLHDWNFVYDPLGNIHRVTDVDPEADANIRYQTADHDRICRIDYGLADPGPGCNVTYDALGNTVAEPTRDGSRQLGYYSSGRIRTIAQQGTQARFSYDPFGRVQALDVQGGASQDQRHDRRFGALLERHDVSSGGATSSSLMRLIPGPGGIFAARRGSGDDWVFEFGEARGNRFFADRSGAFVQDVDYHPFGEAESTGAAPGTPEYTHDQWNGGDALGAFGLSQLGARIYDPVIGRFVSRDPLMSLSSATRSNPYAFANNDPLNSSDPSGLCSGGIGDECHFLTPLNPIGFGLELVKLALGGGSGRSSPAPAPRVSQGPQTPAGQIYAAWGESLVGYDVKGFNVDTFAATGAGPADYIDAIVNRAQSPERAAAMDAPYNRIGSLSAGFGDALLVNAADTVSIGIAGAVASGCGGIGACLRGKLGITSGDADPGMYTLGNVGGTIFVAVAGALAGGGGEGGAAGPPQIVMGDVKSMNSYEQGLQHIAEMEGRGIYNTNGNIGLALYDSTSGEVYLQVFGPRVGNSARTIIWEGQVGYIDIPAGLSAQNIGNAVEEPVRNLVGDFLGQVFRSKTANAHGPDLIPR